MELKELRDCDPIKRILENVVPNIDLENDPFELFEWFDCTPANTAHAMMNVILFLEGHELIEYDPITSVTIDSRLKVSDETKEFSKLFRSSVYYTEKRST